MLVLTKPIDISLPYPFEEKYPLDQILFFDIETTGFAAEVTSLYLIGCIYYQNNQWQLTQWFADDYHSEVTILHSFFQLLSNYQYLIHYNGNGFDLPYLMKKCEQHKLTYNFSDIHSVDLYKKITPYKKIFRLENYKLKTIEQFLDIARDDTYSGGELIHVYGDFLKAKIKGDSIQDDYLHLLLLHNEDDLKGLLQLTKIFSYTDFLELESPLDHYDLQPDKLVLTLNLSSPLAKRLTFGNEDIRITAYQDQATIQIPIYRDELKFFYQNYKDYYYLPKEDMAIHKSVAFYVDKDYRTKAKAATCYSRKTGRFVPQLCDLLTPFFRKEYHDSISYVELTDELLEDSQVLTRYANHLIRSAY